MPKLIEFSDDELRSLQSLMIKLGFDTVKTISSNSSKLSRRDQVRLDRQEYRANKSRKSNN
jgi:hypothetical protein